MLAVCLFLLVGLFLALRSKKIHYFIKMKMVRFGTRKEETPAGSARSRQKPEAIARNKIEQELKRYYDQPKPKTSVLRVPKLSIPNTNTTTSMMQSVEVQPKPGFENRHSTERFRLKLDESTPGKDMSISRSSFNDKHLQLPDPNLTIESETHNNSKVKPKDAFEIEFTRKQKTAPIDEPQLKPAVESLVQYEE